MQWSLRPHRGRRRAHPAGDLQHLLRHGRPARHAGRHHARPGRHEPGPDRRASRSRPNPTPRATTTSPSTARRRSTPTARSSSTSGTSTATAPSRRTRAPTRRHHTSYTAEGTLDVRLRVTDNGGATDLTVRTLTVIDNQPPTAAFTVNPNPVVVGPDRHLQRLGLHRPRRHDRQVRVGSRRQRHATRSTPARRRRPRPRLHRPPAPSTSACGSPTTAARPRRRRSR